MLRFVKVAVYYVGCAVFGYCLGRYVTGPVCNWAYDRIVGDQEN